MPVDGGAAVCTIPMAARGMGTGPPARMTFPWPLAAAWARRLAGAGALRQHHLRQGAPREGCLGRGLMSSFPDFAPPDPRPQLPSAQTMPLVTFRPPSTHPCHMHSVHDGPHAQCRGSELCAFSPPVPGHQRAPTPNLGARPGYAHPPQDATVARRIVAERNDSTVAMGRGREGDASRRMGGTGGGSAAPGPIAVAASVI